MRYVLSILTFFLGITLNAQNISVTDFHLDENDLTANQKGTMEYDQNGNKCALIRIQTTQKGFSFDVGSLGVKKVDDSKVGEIWLYVPAGIKKIDIRHQKLGNIRYDIPINVRSAKTYSLTLSTGKIFVNNYDDTKQQDVTIRIAYKNAKIVLNGANESLDAGGELHKKLSYGIYTYKIDVNGYYPKEGQINVNGDKSASLVVINDLRPIMGSIVVRVNPYQSKVEIDGAVFDNTSTEPYKLQIGKHRVKVTCAGYKTENIDINIEENKTTDIKVDLSQGAKFYFTSIPQGAKVYFDNQFAGNTPFDKDMKTGDYNIEASLKKYQTYRKRIHLDSSNPNVTIPLSKQYIQKTSFYIQPTFQVGTGMAIGGTIGGYLYNINLEGYYLMGLSNSDEIWYNSTSETSERPFSYTYKPTFIGGNIGYSIIAGTRLRITPQAGCGLVSIKATGSKGDSNGYAISASVGCKVDFAFASCLCINVAPEYDFTVDNSANFDILSSLSSKIKNWATGFNCRVGLSLFF